MMLGLCKCRLNSPPGNRPCYWRMLLVRKPLLSRCSGLTTRCRNVMTYEKLLLLNARIGEHISFTKYPPSYPPQALP